MTKHSGLKEGVRVGVQNIDKYMKENGYNKKTKVYQHICRVPGDQTKLLIPFPVCQETGNGIILACSSRKEAMTRKQ